MKRGTADHPKTRRLTQLLGCHHLMTVGTLDRIWEWCARYAPQGDIGRWSAQHVAASIEWPYPADLLMSSLVDAGFLCRAKKPHHLLIHDWKDHAEEAVKKYLQRNSLQFLDCRLLSRHGETPSRRVAPAVAVAVAVAGASTIASNSPEEPSAVIVVSPAPQAPPVGELQPQAKPDTFHLTAGRYVACFNAVFERRVRVTPQIVDRVRTRIRANYRPWQIVALPVMVDAQGIPADMRREIGADVPLRDGKHPRTTASGQTFGATDWLERALQRLDKTLLTPRLADIARQFGVLPQLMECGVGVIQPELLETTQP